VKFFAAEKEKNNVSQDEKSDYDMFLKVINPIEDLKSTLKEIIVKEWRAGQVSWQIQLGNCSHTGRRNRTCTVIRLCSQLLILSSDKSTAYIRFRFKDFSYY